jgi:hypothetical protein
LRSRRRLDLRLSLLISRLYLKSAQVVGFATFHYVKLLVALKNGIIRRIRNCQKLQFDEFVDLWVPRNAKALKCIFLAGEGIELFSYDYPMYCDILVIQ